MSELPEGWEELETGGGKSVYVNEENKLVRWNKPKEGW